MNTRRTILAGLGALSLGGVLGYAFDRASVPANRQAYDAQLPNVPLQTHDGRKVLFQDDLVRDKVVAINMMYLQCTGICPTTTATLRRLQTLLGDRLGRDVFLYSITLQPELDTPEALKAYAERYGVRPGWTFLTGTLPDIRRLRYALGFYDPVPEVDANLGNHTGMLRIGNGATKRWAMAPALCDAERIITTINHLDRRMVETAYRDNRSLNQAS